MSKKSMKTAERAQHISTIHQYLFLAMLFISPFLYGLYTELPFFLVALGLSLVFLFYFIKKNELTFDSFDWLFMALVLSYLLSMVNTPSLRTAYLGFLKYSLYFLCFYTARSFFHSERSKRILVITLVTSITLVTIITILAKLGILPVPGLVSGGRFSGTFFYANTYAAVLIAIILIAFSLLYDNVHMERINTGRNLILLAAVYLNAAALFSSASRGGLLVYGFVSILLILTNRQLRFLIYFITINVVAYLSSYALNYIGIYDTPLSRLAEVSLSGESAFLRFIFYKDALKIFSENWLIGTGAGGWEYLYRLYQPFQYHTETVHSSLLQSLVDVGFVGTSIILALCVSTSLIFYSKYRQGISSLDKGLFLGFIALLLHSLIDFDLSFPAVAMYFFILLGLSVGPTISKKKLVVKPGLLVLASLLIISSSSFAIAGLSTRSAEDTSQQVHPDRFVKNLHIATILDPLNTEYLMDWGEFLVTLGKQKKDSDMIEEGLGKIRKAIKLEPQNYRTYLSMGKLLIQLDKYDEAIIYYEKIIQLMPFHNTGYEYMMRVYITESLEKGNVDLADKALAVYDRVILQMNTITPDFKSYVSQENDLSQSVMLNFNAGVANTVLGNNEKAKEHFLLTQKWAQPALKEETNAWLYIINKRLNITDSSLTAKPEYVERVEKLLVPLQH